MKKYIFLLVVVLSFLGCEKEMMDYEGKDGVYFSVQEAPPSLYGDPEIWAHMDTTLIPFSLLLENVYLISVLKKDENFLIRLFNYRLGCQLIITISSNMWRL